MKPSLEQVTHLDSSFRILLDPNLNDVFYWHFHPEIELVYVEAEEGFRHIGDHLSRYHGSDLVLIGPNIPHLNFDYGVKTRVGTVVIQLATGFQDMDFLNMPEFRSVAGLLSRSKSGLAFTGEMRHRAGERLKALPTQPPFRQMLALLEVLQELSVSTDVTDLGAEPVADVSGLREQQRIHQVYRYIEEQFPKDVGVGEVADLCCLTVPAFCRFFRKATGFTFTEFFNRYRVNQARKLLLQGRTVNETCYACGFVSLPHFSRTFRKHAGESPSAFRKSPRQE